MSFYVPNTPEEQRRMLASMGMSSMDALTAHIPQGVRLSRPLEMESGMGEAEAMFVISDMARMNVSYDVILRGAGAYDHYIPPVVTQMASREEFVTAYTPYQAEMSQGILQSIFEYQTDVCELLGMDAANASVYDGATAAAEAAIMCAERKRTLVLVSAAADPRVTSVIRTYCEASGMRVELIPAKNGLTDISAAHGLDTACCVYLQQPNFYGLIEDAQGIVDAAHAAGAKAVMSVHPIAMTLYRTPGECGADIAVAEGQPLGLPLSYGGPYLGIMAARADMMRRLPGRIVGQTTDADGARAFVLTMQAREQHIKREKASSSICSNEALCALTAGLYMAAMGPQGMYEAAVACYRNAHRLADELDKLGFKRVHKGEFWNEFVTGCPREVTELLDILAEAGILGGLPLPNGQMLWCATEKNGYDIDELVDVLKEAGL